MTLSAPFARRRPYAATRLALGCLGLALIAAQTLSAAPPPEVVRVRDWRAKHERQILGELIRLIALPNLADNRADIAKNADALTAMFEKRGFRVSRWETKGSPIVFARRDVGTTPVDLAAGAGAIDPNVRLYGRSASDSPLGKRRWMTPGPPLP